MTPKTRPLVFAVSALVVALFVAFIPASALAATPAELQSEMLTVEAQLTSLRDEMSLATDNYNLANRNHDQAVADVDACQKEIDATQQRIAQLQGKLSTRATSMYRNGAVSYLDVLMGVSSFGDFTCLWDTLNTLNEDDAELTKANMQAKSMLEGAKAKLQQRQDDAAKQLEAAADYQTKIESMTAQYNAVYNNLSSELQQVIVAQESASSRVQSEYLQETLVIKNDEGEQVEVTYDAGSGGYVDSSGNTYSGDSSAVARAYAALGVTYRYGASGSDAFDCSGLVSYAITGEYGHAYVSQDFWGMNEVSDPQPGDVVACSPGHCGVYIGDGKMIEAPYTGASVKISNIRGKVVRP
jgi:cell wall-associated NlpC family hydrolase